MGGTAQAPGTLDRSPRHSDDESRLRGAGGESGGRDPTDHRFPRPPMGRAVPGIPQVRACRHNDQLRPGQSENVQEFIGSMDELRKAPRTDDEHPRTVSLNEAAL